MTPAEFKALRLAADLTTAGAARQLGVAWSTVWRWETGESKIPATAVLLLQRIERDASSNRKRRARRAK